MSRRKRSLRKVVTSLTVVGLVVLGLKVKETAQTRLFSLQPAYAQRVARQSIAQSPRRDDRRDDVWRQVYQHLPDLPLENQYVNKETGKVAPDNTLINRLIRYHIYVKGRPPNYRLDWKLTLADYLGANEVMEEALYPGYDSLRSNPIEGDRAAIGRLNRKQRDALVQTLVSIFNSNYPATPVPDSNASPQPSTAPNPDTRQISPQPQPPGDAQMLIP